MTGNITIEAREDKQFPSGDPYLRIQSTNKKWYSVKDPTIFHLFVVGNQLEVETVTQGNFTTIVRIIGFEPENPSGGTTLYKTPRIPLTPIPTWAERLLESQVRVEKQVAAILAKVEAIVGKLPPLD